MEKEPEGYADLNGRRKTLKAQSIKKGEKTSPPKIRIPRAHEYKQKTAGLRAMISYEKEKGEFTRARGKNGAAFKTQGTNPELTWTTGGRGRFLRKRRSSVGAGRLEKIGT